MLRVRRLSFKVYGFDFRVKNLESNDKDMSVRV